MVETPANPTAVRPSIDQIWSWLGEIPDPEIPVISILDLGIVRDVCWSEVDAELCTVTVTPTYSGCPATEVIAQQISETLASHGLHRTALRTQLSPPWTTDWLTDRGRQRLHEFGIVPPEARAGEHHSSPLTLLVQITPQAPACPRCGSRRTEVLSQFGSTACKSLHRCLACMEPFDYFKPH